MLDFSGLQDNEQFEDAYRYTESDKESLLEQFRFDDSLDIPISMTDYEVWANYCNDDLYELDKALRKYFKKCRWKRTRDGGFRTTASLVFAYLFGRKPTYYDTKVTRLLNTLLRYYASSMTGKSKIDNRPATHVYNFTKYATIGKAPYSIRLRMEEAREKGIGFSTTVRPNIGKDHKPTGRGRSTRQNGKKQNGANSKGGRGATTKD